MNQEEIDQVKALGDEILQEEKKKKAKLNKKDIMLFSILGVLLLICLTGIIIFGSLTTSPNKKYENIYRNTISMINKDAEENEKIGKLSSFVFDETHYILYVEGYSQNNEQIIRSTITFQDGAIKTYTSLFAYIEKYQTSVTSYATSTQNFEKVIDNSCLDKCPLYNKNPKQMTYTISKIEDSTFISAIFKDTNNTKSPLNYYCLNHIPYNLTDHSFVFDIKTSPAISEDKNYDLYHLYQYITDNK